VSIIAKLLTVQEQDCRIRGMERELRDIPERKKTELTRLDEHKKALADAETALKTKQADLKKFELETQSLQERIVKLRQQQGELKTNKEFKAMEDEIKTVQREISKLEDKELVHMEELEAARAEVESRKAALTEEEAAVQSDLKTLDSRAAAIQGMISEAKTNRGVEVKDIPGNWLSNYERVFSRKDDALVVIEDGICGGCHMKLPPSIINETKKVDAMVACSNCGRMLHCQGGGG
jgi:predicted  nucleic acid-binding Zn-ribbon protein